MPLCIAYLGYGDPTTDTPDPFVFFMKEAWRCLEWGGVLTLRVPRPDSAAAFLSPLYRRVFPEQQFYCFGVSQTKLDEWRAEGHAWKWNWADEDFGTRFEILQVGRSEREMTVVMEKREGEWWGTL